jgi:hypothetical protein
MTIINTPGDLADLLALTREIETTEGVSKREAFRRALHELNVGLWDIAADVRYVPAGWTIAPHVSLSLPPMVWDGADPLLAVGH